MTNQSMHANANTNASGACTISLRTEGGSVYAISFSLGHNFSVCITCMYLSSESDAPYIQCSVCRDTLSVSVSFVCPCLQHSMPVSQDACRLQSRVHDILSHRCKHVVVYAIIHVP